MNELVKVNYGGDQPTVLGRDLHAALAVETPYHKCMHRGYSLCSCQQPIGCAWCCSICGYGEWDHINKVCDRVG